MLNDFLNMSFQTYVQYMKFARRAEGIKSARTIFKKSREDPRSRYHVFVAAALMEYYCSKDKDIAFRIFELGLKRFGGSPEFVMCYIDYLSHLNGKIKPNYYNPFGFIIISVYVPRGQQHESAVRTSSFVGRPNANPVR